MSASRRNSFCVVSTLAILALGTLSSYCDPLPGNERGPINFAAGKDASGVLPRLVGKWNQRHPDEKVTILELSFSADEQRISMAQNFQAGSSRYDVVYADVAWAAEFAARGWIESLDEHRFVSSNIVPTVANTARFNGKLFGAPYTAQAGMLFYRTDLIKSPPKTWAELKYLCQTISKQSGIGCYAGQFAQYEGLTVNVAEAIASAGGSLVADDGNEVTVDSPEGRDGLRFLVDGFQQGWIPKAAITYKEEESRRAFQQGQLLFLRNWPYVYSMGNAPGSDSAVAGKIGVAAIPGLNGTGRSIIGGKNLMLSRFSTHKASAEDWIEFMQSEEAQAELDNPVLLSLYENAALRQRLPFLPILRDVMLHAATRPSTSNYHAVSLVIQKNAYAALQGRKTVDQAVVDMADDLRRAITGHY